MTNLSRIRTALLAAAAVIAIAGTAALALFRDASPGSSLAVPVAFSLTDHTGATVTGNELNGRLLLVVFGFTNCHAICPTQMSKLTAAMQQIDETGHASLVTPVFISVDPERDSPQQVADFLTRFDSRFVGLTGSRAALSEAAASFKSYLHAAPPPGSTDYQVVHATTIYIVDPDGRIVGYVSGSENADAIAAAVRESLG